MESSPKQPQKKREERPSVLIAVQWLKELLLIPQGPTISSLGEFLLPILFGIMESCWLAAILIGLASIGLFESSDPLLPLWAPFLFIVGSMLLFHYVELRAAQRASSSHQGNHAKVAVPETLLFIIVIGVLSLFFVWLHAYAQTAFVFDPKWLLALLNDVLLLNLHFYEVVSIIVLSFIFGWRGIRLVNRDIEPSNVFRVLCLGLGIMILVIMLRTGRESAGVVFHDDVLLLLLIPFFLFVSLVAHALARVSFIRRSHPTGLQGSIVVQERAIMIVIGSLGLVLFLVAILVSSSVNPSFLQTLAPLGAAIARAYDWLVEVVADVAVIIATPFFWLLYLFTRLFPPKAPGSNTNQGQLSRPKLPSFTPNSTSAIIPFVKIILPIVILLLIFALIWWTLRRRRRVRIAVQRQKEDVHESVWSWKLFWSQFKAFFLALFARFFPRGAATEENKVAVEEIKSEPATRSIREIYRALLRKAANRGYARKRYETPHEFKQRLDEKVPLVEPQLELITEAYALTRYGGEVPDESHLESVRDMWVELDKKWV